MFYEDTLYSLRSPLETGVLLLLDNLRPFDQWELLDCNGHGPSVLCVEWSLIAHFCCCYDPDTEAKCLFPIRYRCRRPYRSRSYVNPPSAAIWTLPCAVRPDPAEQRVWRARLGPYLSFSLSCFVSLSQAAGGEGFLVTLLISAPQYPSPELQNPSEGNLRPLFCEISLYFAIAVHSFSSLHHFSFWTSGEPSGGASCGNGASNLIFLFTDLDYFNRSSLPFRASVRHQDSGLKLCLGLVIWSSSLWIPSCSGYNQF